MQKLVCVGGPLAGQTYEVESINQPIVIPHVVEGEGLDAVYEQTLYTPERVIFCNRPVWVLLHPPMRSQGIASQEHAIVKALCKPEVYDAWADALRPRPPWHPLERGE